MNLRDVLPIPALADVAQRPGSDSVAGRKFGVCSAVGFETANLRHVALSDLREWKCASDEVESSDGIPSTAFDHIRSVFLCSAIPQVPGIAARRVVTRVQSHRVVSVDPRCEEKSDAMAMGHSILHSKLAVPLTPQRRNPRPTLVGCANGDLLPKPFDIRCGKLGEHSDLLTDSGADSPADASQRGDFAFPELYQTARTYAVFPKGTTHG